jgi:hypothetical protein|tara:strand:+ start:1034 stop:1300 length:267 start_codon:yes stop_codon:yes gene_type:complete
MIKNILSVLIFAFSISFFYFLGNVYFSDNQLKKVKYNRETISKKIKNNIAGLLILPSNTNNAIEFNSGFENKNKKRERNFWKLFIKND